MATGIADKVAALVIVVQKWHYTRVDKGKNHGAVPNSDKNYIYLPYQFKGTGSLVPWPEFLEVSLCFWTSLLLQL